MPRPHRSHPGTIPPDSPVRCPAVIYCGDDHAAGGLDGAAGHHARMAAVGDSSPPVRPGERVPASSPLAPTTQTPPAHERRQPGTYDLLWRMAHQPHQPASSWTRPAVSGRTPASKKGPAEEPPGRCSLCGQRADSKAATVAPQPGSSSAARRARHSSHSHLQVSGVVVIVPSSPALTAATWPSSGPGTDAIGAK